MAPQQSAKFRTVFFGQFRTSLRKDSIANYASKDIESNTSLGGLQLDPAGMHCPAGDDAFVSSFLLLFVTLRVRSIVRTRIALPFIGRFQRGFSVFFPRD